MVLPVPVPVPVPTLSDATRIMEVVTNNEQTEPLRQRGQNTLTPLVKRQRGLHKINKHSGVVQPITLCKTTKARKPTSEVTDTTARRRWLELQGAPKVASAGKEHSLLQIELRIIPRAELQTMLRNMDLATIRIPDGHLLTAQTDIGINLSQTRQPRRWLKGYGITMESEKTSRDVAKGLLCNVQVT
ncbi:Hypp7628 [Branchiostoma lanceolatum]|uniref:Hypp7628 protein n=1 Tax=Branchiostoma lanceolatum TaxID=7740 RepID=A0A8K0EAG9_BRALA|nr:Hypp7628 [Branchiostoma lanceolatum]